jgi:LPS-assembly protein
VETHNRSDITGEMRFYPTANSWLGLDLLWDQREDEISQTQLTWHYRGEDNSLYNLGYSLRRGNALGSGIDEPLEQLDASVALPLGLQWRVFARWQHDIGNNRRLENLLGVAYESCCWQVRLAWRRSLEPDDGSLSNVKVDRAVLLEFQFRGLGGIGDRITTALEESIFGYRER